MQSVLGYLRSFLIHCLPNVGWVLPHTTTLVYWLPVLGLQTNGCIYDITAFFPTTFLKGLGDLTRALEPLISPHLLGHSRTSKELWVV